MKILLTFSALIACAASPAMAHVTANPDRGQADSYFQTSFRISHGCEGSDTNKVTVQIPPGILTLKPQAKPGWKVETTKRKLKKPMPAGHGKMADEEFSEVIWSGGPLSDSQYDEFGILIKLPAAPDTTLWFPVTQICVKGKNEWIEIPKKNQSWHDVKNPAPFVRVTGGEPKMRHTK